LKVKALNFLLIYLFSNSLVAQVNLSPKINPSSISLSFTGADQWDYKVESALDIYSIKLPKLNLEQLNAALKLKLPDGIVMSYDKAQSTVSYDVIRIDSSKSKNKWSVFEYFNGKPSSLIIDFYADEKQVTKAQNSESESKNKKLKPTILSEKKIASPKSSKFDKLVQDFSIQRNPAQEIVLLNEEPVSTLPAGLLDGADLDFERFKVPRSELRADPLVYSRLQDYIDYPFLNDRLKALDKMKQNMPTYEVLEQDITNKDISAEEVKMAQLLVKLFKNKRYFVFFKTAEWFNKKFTKSKYDELVKFMKADSHYLLFQDDKKKYQKHLSIAQSFYEEAIEQYPQSNMTERAVLFMGYTALESKDYIMAVKWLQRHTTKFQDSPRSSQSKLALVKALMGAAQYADATTISKKMIAEGCNQAEQLCLLKWKLILADTYIAQSQWKDADDVFLNIYNIHKNMILSEERFLYNWASVLFRLDKFELALERYLDFVKAFPSDKFSGYALTRIGEIIDILSVNSARSLGAYQEAYFRYGTGESSTAIFSRIRMLQKQLPTLKEKAQVSAINEIKKLANQSNLKFADNFAEFVIAQALSEKGDYDKSLEMLIQSYQANPSGPLSKIYYSKIQNETSKKFVQMAASNKIDSLKFHQSESDKWLKGTHRMDVQYTIGNIFHKLGQYQQAAQYYIDSIKILSSLDKESVNGKIRIYNEKLPELAQIKLELADALIQDKKYSDASEYLKESDKQSDLLSEDLKIKKSILHSKLLSERGQSEYALRYINDLLTIKNYSKGNELSLVLEKVNLLSQANNTVEIINIGPRLSKLCKSVAEEDLFKCFQAESKYINVIKADIDKANAESSTVAMRAAGLSNNSKSANTASSDSDLKPTVTKPEYMTLLSDYLIRYENKFPLESKRFELGKLYLEKGDLKNAVATWNPLENKESVWSKLVKSEKSSEAFKSDYRNYIKRIPAFSQTDSPASNVKE